jgi:hypothetical protein
MKRGAWVDPPVDANLGPTRAVVCKQRCKGTQRWREMDSNLRFPNRSVLFLRQPTGLASRFGSRLTGEQGDSNSWSLSGRKKT